jgi:hypothetical protein
MKVELWTGVTQSGSRLMTWWGCEKPHMKPMKPRAQGGLKSNNINLLEARTPFYGITCLISGDIMLVL